MSDVERVLRENGLSDEPGQYDSSIHSWRCEHPDMYGPCECFQELAAELESIIAARIADFRSRAVAAIEEERDGFLDSPSLDPAWIAGWHSATDWHAAHTVARLDT